MGPKIGNWVTRQLKKGDRMSKHYLWNSISKTTKRRFFAINSYWRWKIDILYQSLTRKSLSKTKLTIFFTAKAKYSLCQCIWWSKKEVLYFVFLKPTETITGDVYQRQLMRLKANYRKASRLITGSIQKT